MYRRHKAGCENKKDKIAILQDLHQERGERRFRKGDIKGSVDDFEHVVKSQPSRKAHHWQLGISYYYSEQFKEGKALFELHKTVNPHDVENAVWHFICNVKINGFEKAQKELIPIKGDDRIPMMDIYELFAGRMKLKRFLENLPEYTKSDSPQTTSLMYAHQYLGLYYEAIGQKEKAKEHMQLSIKAYKSYKIDHYMGDVSISHAIVRKWNN